MASQDVATKADIEQVILSNKADIERVILSNKADIESAIDKVTRSHKVDLENIILLMQQLFQQFEEKMDRRFEAVERRNQN